VFDQYGNALPDYKVVFQIVQQGTTTVGTIPTYHPYAHFEDADNNDPPDQTLTGLLASISDTNINVKINPIWDNFVTNWATPARIGTPTTTWPGLHAR